MIQNNMSNSEAVHPKSTSGSMLFLEEVLSMHQLLYFDISPKDKFMLCPTFLFQMFEQL